jgi:NADH-quinone oxidoreductase subunit L
MVGWLALIPGLPLAAAGAVSLAGNRIRRWAGWVTASAVFLALVLAVKVLLVVLARPGVREFSFPWLATAGGLNLEVGFLVDPLSASMLVLVTLVSLMIQLYSLGYMAGDTDRTRYFTYLSLFTFSMLGLVLANNLIFMYMFWELVGLCSYLLIGFWYAKPEAANAGKKAFVVTRFGDLGFLVGILVIGHLLNTFNIPLLGQAAAAGQLTGTWPLLVALLLFAGAVGKSAQFPLHVWLPDAMEGPTPVSALIHAATMVAAGVFMVARLFPVFAAAPDALTVIAYLGGGTAFLAATMACVQTDIKRILAYSTVSQLGYMFLALGSAGYSAGIFHLLTHGAFKALLFLAAGSVIHALHTNSIWEMGGLWRGMRITAAVTLVGALALAGVFPFSGFFSKDAVLLAVAHSGRLDLLAIGLVTALLTSFYIFRLFFAVFTGKPSAGKAGHESPAVMTLPMLLLALISLVLGLWSEPLQHFLGQALGAAAPGAGHNRLIPLLAFLAACFGFAWAYLVYYQKAVSAALLARRFSWVYALVANQYYIDAAYQFLVRRLLFGLAAGLAWFDRHVVDGAVNGVGWMCRQTGLLLRLAQVGRLSAYILALVVGLLIMAVTVLLSQSAALAWPW